MNKNLLSDALDNISLSAAAETASIREKAAPKPRRLPKIAAAAAAVAVCAALATAIAAGGGLIDVKNVFGTVTGQEYFGDATDDFKVSVLRLGANGIELSVEKTDPSSKIDLNGSRITALSYSVSDSEGNVVVTDEPDEKFLRAIPEGYTPTDDRADVIEQHFSGNADGSMEYTTVVTHRRKYVNPDAEPDFREVFFTESEEVLKSGTYTLNLESFRISRKGDQDLDVSGSWTAEFTV